ncbi:MAG: hypothetical protein DMG53_26670 [Acidobacteria bacterium]|nr:MAG: hypothetical protein DMG53_26670 [Acidobacteriota bacterium]
MISLGDMILRLTVAAALGAVIGIERDLRRRPAGVRTSLFVCLATFRGSRNRHGRRRGSLLRGCLCDGPGAFRTGGHRLVRRSPQLEAPNHGVPDYREPSG